MIVDGSIDQRAAMHSANRSKWPRVRRTMKWVGTACLAFLAYSHSPAWAVSDACHYSNGRRSLDRPWDSLNPVPLTVIAAANSLSTHPVDLGYKLRWRAGRPVWILHSAGGFTGSYLYFDLAGFLIASATWDCQSFCKGEHDVLWSGPALDAAPERAFADVAASAR